MPTSFWHFFLILIKENVGHVLHKAWLLAIAKFMLFILGLYEICLISCLFDIYFITFSLFYVVLHWVVRSGKSSRRKTCENTKFNK